MNTRTCFKFIQGASHALARRLPQLSVHKTETSVLGLRFVCDPFFTPYMGFQSPDIDMRHSGFDSDPCV